MPARKQRTVTGEVVLDRGSFASDPTYATELVSRLRTERGSVIVQPNYGSRLHEIKKLTPNSKTLAEKFAELAAKPMITQRKIKSASFSARVERTYPGAYIAINCAFVDRRGRKQSITYNHRLGT